MPFRRSLVVAMLAVATCIAANCSASASHVGGSSHATSTERLPSSTTFADWPTYHGDAARTGYAPTMPTVTGLSATSSTLDGAVYASPIVESGRVVVATENDTVYAFDHGSVVWQRHLATPAAQQHLPCGNIFPLGITGTPAYDNGVVYVAAESDGTPAHHRLYALDVATGATLWSRPLDFGGVDAAAMQQRGALLVAGGRVWVPFGGLAGDCGAYKGRVVGIPTDGTSAAVVYTVPTKQQGGIWTPPGPSFDGTDLYVAVGNGAATAPADKYDKTDSVLKISLAGKLDQFFAPASWASDNANDLDLGSQGPTIVGNWIYADGKSGTAYVLNRAKLGGIGHPVSSAAVCASYGGTAVLGSSVFVPCNDGVRRVDIDSAGAIQVVWHAASNIAGSPVIGGGAVWSIDRSGTLYELDPATGTVLGSIAVGRTSRFATPAIYGSTLYIPTMTGLTVVTTS
jgi:outer membrane protein assembly factor BamB